MDYCIINMSWLGSSNNQSYGQMQQPFSNMNQVNTQFPNAASNGFTNPALFTQQNSMHYYDGQNISHLHSGFSGRLTYHDKYGEQYQTNAQGVPIDPNTGLAVDSSVQLYDQYNKPYHKSIFSWFGSGNNQQTNNNGSWLGGRRKKRKTLTKGGKRSRKSRKARRRRTRRM